VSWKGEEIGQGRSPRGGKLLLPSNSTGTRLRKHARSSFTGWAERLRLATHRMDSSSYSLKYATTFLLPGCRN